MRYGLDKEEYRNVKKIWKQTVEQEIILLKCEVASLKEHIKHCTTEIKVLGERKLSESTSPASPIKGFETTTNPFLTIKNDNNVKKIDFNFQVTAALGNNDVCFEEPKVKMHLPTSPSFGPFSPQAKGTYKARYRSTLDFDTRTFGIFPPFRVNVRHQSITCMQEYSDKSFEELRLEDYAIKENMLRSISQVKLKDSKWGLQKPLRRFSYTRRDKSSPHKFGGWTPSRVESSSSSNREGTLPWSELQNNHINQGTVKPFFSNLNGPPILPWSKVVGSMAFNNGNPPTPSWLDGAMPNPFTIENKQNTNTTKFPPPLFRFPSSQTGVISTSNSNQQEQQEVLNLVVSKLEKMEVQMTNVNACLQALGSQVSSMDSRLVFPQPFTAQEILLKEKVTLAPPKLRFSLPSTTNQSTSEMVQESTSFADVETERKKTAETGTNTPPVKVDIAVNTSTPLVSKETNTDQELMGSPKQMDISQPSIKFTFSSPILNVNSPSFESKLDYNESNASVNFDGNTIDENKIDSQDNEKNNNLFNLTSENDNIQNLNTSDCNSNAPTPTSANQIAIDKDILKTEENISDSEKDFEIVEKEELAQEISSEENKDLNLSSIGNQDSNLYHDVTEYMEIQLGKKKGEVYEFGFEVKADNVVGDASTSFMEGQAVNKDDSFHTFMSNLIHKSKSKHSSPSIDLQVSDGVSKSSGKLPPFSKIL